MRPVETADPELDIDGIIGILESAPVRLAILFGSHATGGTHPRSDVDIAVEFEGLRPGDEGYHTTFLGLSVDLSETLGTDDVDLVDLHTAPPSLVDQIVDAGILLVGEPAHAAALRRELTAGSTDDRSPRERLDETIARIDEHLA